MMLEIYHHDQDAWETIAKIDKSEYQVPRSPEQVYEIKAERFHNIIKEMQHYGFRR